MRFNIIDDNDRYKTATNITLITIIINIFLSIIKIFFGISQNSTALLADGIHTISDVGSSIGIILSFMISKKPEDDKHQYGHEKAESIATLILAIFLTAVGIKIGFGALKIIITNQTVVPKALTIWITLISIIVKEVQFRLCMYGGKKINSKALIADAWHHRSDVFSSIAALIGIIGSRLGFSFLDPLAGLIVSIIVIKVGIRLFIEGCNDLMDCSLEKEKINKLINNIKSSKKIIHVKQLRTRKHGSKVFVDIKVCVDPNMTVSDSQYIVKEVETIVINNIGNVKEVLVYVNPCNINYKHPL
ncbi:MAG: cation transporter [Firmicutes bacterium]|nr:cation transporter [Bacillota bacterium]